jgi:hypothetical protein
MEIQPLVITLYSVLSADLFTNLSTWKWSRNTFKGEGHEFLLSLYNITRARFPIATAKAVAMAVVITSQIVS